MIDGDKDTLAQRTEFDKPELFTSHKFSTSVAIDRQNPLASILELKINESPQRLLPWSDFMATSLFNPEYGYYSRHVEIGSEKDFSTIPEKIEKFGQYVGISLLHVWKAMGTPNFFQLVEMGAGNGTLAKNILAWAKTEQPDFYNAIFYTIVEQSPKLIGNQQKTLQEFTSDVTTEVFNIRSRRGKQVAKVQWESWSAIEFPLRNVEGAIISNELPDAFPVERVIRINGEIRQKYVTVENDTWIEVWGEPSVEIMEHIKRFGYTIPEGVEEPINLAAVAWQKNCAAALKKGAMLTFDYGEDGEVGDKSKVCIRNYGGVEGNHVSGRSDIFAAYKALGGVDMTADINFRTLQEVAEENGLTTIYSGLQSHIMLANGLADEIAEAKSKWEASRDLGNGIRYWNRLRAAKSNGFYTHFSFKGIASEISVPMTREDAYNYPTVHFFLPIGAMQIRVFQRQGTYTLEDKVIEYNPQEGLTFGLHDFYGTTIYDESGNVILDLGKDKQKINELIAAARIEN